MQVPRHEWLMPQFEPAGCVYPHFEQSVTYSKTDLTVPLAFLSNNAGRLPGKSKKRFLSQLKPLNPDHKPPSRKDLVYYENSPNFCEKNLKFGIPGTQGRVCNESSIGMDGCDLMCCGRGYKTEVKEVVERCNCTFHWCCEVKCKVCRTKRTIHTCL